MVTRNIIRLGERIHKEKLKKQPDQKQIQKWILEQDEYFERLNKET